MTNPAISERPAVPGAPPPADGTGDEAAERLRGIAGAGVTTTCKQCGQEAEPLHRGCTLCEDCCDCRP